MLLFLLFLAWIHCDASQDYLPSALILGDRLASCSFSPSLGVFVEQLWQSGATLETVANVQLLSPPGSRQRTALTELFAQSFARTPVIVDNCFDDHQWWGLAWARAYTATLNTSYLQRSAAVFDFVAARGWNTTLCGGGVTWCPPPTGPYKNAITAELFLSLAMALHPHATLAGKPAAFYSTWAATVWAWLRDSGMINAQGLLNDGLSAATCTNNGQTTWSYNQGVLLSGLYRLAAATADPEPLAAAVRTANATMALLTIDGVLVEPCPGGTCSGHDSEIFKGMFVKHLGYMLAEDSAASQPLLPPAFAAQAAAFLATNAKSLLAQDTCKDGGAGFRWEGSLCDIETVATTSAGLDLLLASAAVAAVPRLPASTWVLAGLGNCADAAGASMPNCFQAGITLQACRDAAFVTGGTLAFDFHSECLAEGSGFCRLRTLGNASACSGGFAFEGGAATGVVGGDGSSLTACYIKSQGQSGSSGSAAAAAAGSTAAATAAADPGRPSLGVDLPSYLSTADLLWGWNASGGPDPLAPLHWSQGAYLGNGLLGVMVTAQLSSSNSSGSGSGATPSLRLDVGRTDLWVQEQRQPIGYLTVTPQSSPLAAVHMRLCLLTATLLFNLTLASGGVVSGSLAVNAADPLGPTGVVWLSVDAASPAAAGGEERGGAAPALLLQWTPDTSGVGANTTVASGVQGGTQWWTQGGAATGSYTTALSITAAAGSSSSSGQQLLLLAVASDQRTGQPAWSSRPAALAAISASAAAGLPALQAAHSALWLEYWGAGGFFTLDSAGGTPRATALEIFTHIAGYRYASAARFGMHDLMGPWGPGHASTCLGPWCQYCWDMNQQVMIYPNVLNNRGELLARPALAQYASALNGTGRSRYGSNPPPPTVDALWWLANMARFGSAHGDDALQLSTLLPGLQAVLAGLIPSGTLRNSSSDGWLHVAGCSSPEYPGGSGRSDCSYHLAIIRWAAATAAALAQAGGPPGSAALPLYTDLLRRLAPAPVDPATGALEVAAGLPFAQPHRHYSHLLALHDLGQPGASALPAGSAPPIPTSTLAATLDQWWNITCSGPQAHGPGWLGDHECRGFTQAAMAAMSGRLNRTGAALGNLTSYLALVGLPNGMYGEEVYAGHPEQFSPVSESAYSAAASVYGLLLAGSPDSSSASSAAGECALFGDGSVPLQRPVRVSLWPAAPWANASFFRLRAPCGALLVSAQRAGGATEWVSLEAVAGAGGGGAGAGSGSAAALP